MSDVDIEKAPTSEKGQSEVTTSHPDFSPGTIVEIDPTANHIHGTDWLSQKLKKLGVNVEDRGIERVPPINVLIPKPLTSCSSGDLQMSRSPIEKLVY